MSDKEKKLSKKIAYYRLFNKEENREELVELLEALESHTVLGESFDGSLNIPMSFVSKGEFNITVNGKHDGTLVSKDILENKETFKKISFPDFVEVLEGYTEYANENN